MKIIWTLRAAGQLEAQVKRIEADHPLAAAVLVKRVGKALDQVARLPLSGHRFPEFPGEQAREVVLAPLRMIYRVEHDRVVILSIKHCREQLRVEDLRPDYP